MIYVHSTRAQIHSRYATRTCWVEVGLNCSSVIKATKIIHLIKEFYTGYTYIFYEVIPFLKRMLLTLPFHY